MCFKFFFVAFVLVCRLEAFAQPAENLPKSVIYKKIDTTVLRMSIVYPPVMEVGKHYGCIVFFFGGGWNTGDLTQFQKHADYYSKKGLVCFLADYRVKTRQGTTPFESLKDAKSAIRFIRKNAGVFHINKDSVVASGGSAGGQLAAAAALVDGYNELTDDTSVTARPNALILFNPVIDNGPGGYGYERIGENYKNFSPLHNIGKDAPPTIILLGTKDNLVPVETAQYYKKAMEKVGGRCDLILYEGQGHGFFNKKEYYDKNLVETDNFLASLGYIKSAMPE